MVNSLFVLNLKAQPYTLGAVFWNLVKPGCHISKGKAALVEYENIAAIKASLFKLDPYHLLYGTSACDDLWMWTEEVRENGSKY